VEGKARKWFIDVAIPCPATKSVTARQYKHVNPGVSAKAGAAAKRNKFKGAVQGFVVDAGGRLGPAAKNFIDEVVAECEMSEAAPKAAASGIVRASGIQVLHKQAYIHDGHVDSRAMRSEEQLMADFGLRAESG
jgi:hypothetical protein